MWYTTATSDALPNAPVVLIGFRPAVRKLVGDRLSEATWGGLWKNVKLAIFKE